MRPFVVAVLVATVAAPTGLSRGAKRRNTWYEGSVSAAETVLTRAAELLHISKPPFVYHADQEGAKNELIDALWSGAWLLGVSNRFETANPALTYLLEEQRVDDDDGATRFRELQGQSSRAGRQ